MANAFRNGVAGRVSGAAIDPYAYLQVQLIWPQGFATVDLVYPAPPYDER